jgi:hypothetical protein
MACHSVVVGSAAVLLLPIAAIVVEVYVKCMISIGLSIGPLYI